MDANLIFTCLPSLRTLIVSPSVADTTLPSHANSKDGRNRININRNAALYITFLCVLHRLFSIRSLLFKPLNQFHASFNDCSPKPLCWIYQTYQSLPCNRIISSTASSINSVDAFYLTMGRYDIVIIVDAPDVETATKIILSISSKGAVSTETLHAFSEKEYRKIISELP